MHIISDFTGALFYNFINKGVVALEEKYIGVLDSGLGGLTILKDLLRELPDENFVYLGDNQRAPYGNRSDKKIEQYTDEMVAFLQRYPLKMLVLACNTITAAVQEHLESYLDIPVVGVIEPAAKAALEITKNKKIGVIATEKTISSKAYQDTFKEKGLEKIYAKACQELVNIVEENKMDTEESYQIVAENLETYRGTDIDTLVLGCTHFPYLEKEIYHFFEGENKIQLVHAGIILPHNIYKQLEKRNELQKPIGKRNIDLYTTGDIETFEEVAEGYIGDKKGMTISKIKL